MNYPILLACEYSRILREWLSPEEIATIITRNILDNDAGCHSHNFCDPNQAVIDAFTKVVGREPECGLTEECAEDMHLMDLAMNIAKLSLFATEDNLMFSVETEPAITLMQFIEANCSADPEQLSIHDTTILLSSAIGQPHNIGMITVKRIA